MITAYADDLMDLDEVLERFNPVMGVEVHVGLSTSTEMFSSSSVDFGAEPNSDADPCNLSLPSAPPVVNRQGVRWAIEIGLTLNYGIAESSRFARKNYFYPDQPKNYQISQYNEPITYDGYFDVQLDDGTKFRVEIERAHMEEDTGKLTHLGGTDGRIHGATRSLVDYSRTGIPLIEIVTKPILGAGERAPEIARVHVSALYDLVKSLGVSNAHMDQDSTRVDSNVSLCPIGQGGFSTRTETKNISSLESAEQAVRYEMQRQAATITNDEEIVQETRHYQETNSTTSKSRPRESQSDYRCFDDPDLPPVIAPREWVEEIHTTLSELPWACHARIREEWGLKDKEVHDLVNAGALDLIVDTVEAGTDPTETRPQRVTYLAQKANEVDMELAELAIIPVQVARMIILIGEGKLISELVHKAVNGVLAGEGDVDEVVATRGLGVVRNDGAIERAVDDVLADNPDIVEKYRAGSGKVVDTVVGQIMRTTRGKADPAQTNRLIAKKPG